MFNKEYILCPNMINFDAVYLVSVALKKSLKKCFLYIVHIEIRNNISVGIIDKMNEWMNDYYQIKDIV